MNHNECLTKELFIGKDNECSRDKSVCLTISDYVEHNYFGGGKNTEFKCMKCGFVARYISQLQQHVVKHSKERPFTCLWCSESFKRKAHLDLHERQHCAASPNGEMLVSISKKRHLSACPILRRNNFCVAKRSDSVILNDKNNHSNSELKCDHCEFTAQYPSTMKLHMVKHFNERPFVCQQCSKAFKRKSALNTHQKNVHGKFPVGVKEMKCDKCDFTAAYLAQFERHMRIHSGERPYKCKFCSKRFRLKGNLRRHNRIHSIQCPFLCDICGKVFKGRLLLNKHRHYVHGKKFSGLKILECIQCEFVTDLLPTFKEHMKIHSNERQFQCRKCMATFKRECDLNMHGKAAHNINWAWCS